LARLFFGYFLLAKQKKVTRPTGRNRYQKTLPFFCLLFFGEAKKSKAGGRPKPDLKTMHCKYCTYGSPRRCAPRDDQALQAFLLITFLWPSKEK